jgi:hypothetical protein
MASIQRGGEEHEALLVCLAETQHQLGQYGAALDRIDELQTMGAANQRLFG